MPQERNIAIDYCECGAQLGIREVGHLTKFDNQGNIQFKSSTPSPEVLTKCTAHLNGHQVDRTVLETVTG